MTYQEFKSIIDSIAYKEDTRLVPIQDKILNENAYLRIVRRVGDEYINWKLTFKLKNLNEFKVLQALFESLVSMEAQLVKESLKIRGTYFKRPAPSYSKWRVYASE